MTGGQNRAGDVYSSTEVFVKGGASWTLYENSLPSKMWGIGSISFNNQVFVVGKQLFSTQYLIYTKIMCSIFRRSSYRWSSTTNE